MEIVENIALISINETMIFQLVSFLLFLFILNRVMIRPLRNTMMDREAHLELMAQEIASADQAYDDISRRIRKEESVAKKAAFKQRDRLENEGEATASALIEKTKAEIGAMRMKAQKETDAKIAAARKGIEKEIEAISDEMIAALLGRRS